jgi:hypothetical protein
MTLTIDTTFTPPADLAEFQQRYPRWIAGLVRNHHPNAGEEKWEQIRQAVVERMRIIIPRITHEQTFTGWFNRLRLCIARDLLAG